MSLRHIPGDEGWPLVGLLPKYFYHLDTLVMDIQRRFGNVARMRIPGSVGLFVFGADNFQRIVLDKERLFSAREGLQATLGQLFTEALLLQDYDDHRFQRRMMQGAFKNHSLRQYPALMNPIIADELAGWSGPGATTMHSRLKNMLLKVSAKTFFGIAADNSDALHLGRSFGDMVDAMLAMVRWDVPGFSHHRGLRGRRALEQFFDSVIPQRRDGDGQDMLSHMCRETNDNGALFSNEEITNQAIFLLFAAHDTTTSLLSNLLLHLAQDENLQEKVRAESLALDNRHLAFDDLNHLGALDNCIDECLRLYPPAPLSARATLRDCEIEGYAVPAGTTLYLPMIFNHRDPRFWREPDHFDPDRFAPGREEHKQHPFAYHPFGGGAHKCIGMHFARMMAKCVMHQLLLSQRFTLPTNYHSRHLWVPLPRPTRLPLTFTPC
ncbi:MAG TPA: cytochrome P450 [Spongiibacteraceae bacterium]|nr:cytochrome P450 [Spongiibacteraceae bacterium]